MGCERTLPNAKSDASTSKIKGLSWLAWLKIGAHVNARFKLSNASAALKLVGKHVPPDGTGWNRMKDAENRLIAEPAPIGAEPIGTIEM